MSCIIHVFTNCTFTTFLRRAFAGNKASLSTHADTMRTSACGVLQKKYIYIFRWSFTQPALCPHRSPYPLHPLYPSPPMSKNRIHLMPHQWINKNAPLPSPPTTTTPQPPPISNAEGEQEDTEGLVAASSLRRSLLATVHDDTISFQSAMSTSQRRAAWDSASAPVKCLCF